MNPTATAEAAAKNAANSAELATRSAGAAQRSASIALTKTQEVSAAARVISDNLARSQQNSDNAQASAIAAKQSVAEIGTVLAQTQATSAQTAQDRIATGMDRVQTGLDRTATGLDRAATGQDSLATAQALLSAEQAAQVATDQAQLGTSQAALAAGQADLASTYALSVLQQDLSGVTGVALHRSPNAIVAMFIYDTSKDSDGGAWTERMADKSWYNEDLNGPWLGSALTEMDARDLQGQGANLITGDNSTFDLSVGQWVAGGNTVISAVDGRLRITATGVSPVASLQIATVVDQRYKIDLNYLTAVSGKNLTLGVGTIQGSNNITALNMLAVANGANYLVFVATTTTTWINVQGSSTYASGDFAEVSSVTLRPVLNLISKLGAYYQNKTDGKFYRLRKNLFTFSNNLSQGTNSVFHLTVAPNILTSALGTLFSKLIVDTVVNTQHWFNKPFDAVQGVTYTYRVLAKAGEFSKFNCFTSGPVGALSCVFDLISGTVSGSGSASGTITPVIGDPGVYVCTYSFQSKVTGAQSVYLGQLLDNSGAGTYTGDGTSGLYLSSPQLSVGTLADTNATQPVYEVKTNADKGQSEVFRGNKAKFPRLSAIVLELNSAANVRATVYDLTEPGRPMWGLIGGKMPAYSATVLTSVFALNGKIIIGGNAGYIGFLSVDFPHARCVWEGNGQGGAGNGRFLKENFICADIDRFSTVTPSSYTTFESNAFTLSNNAINAVVMTILPNAPVDPISGLQIPTIGVGHQAGATFIRHDGSVVNTSGNPTTVGAIAVNSTGFIVSRNASIGMLYLWTHAQIAAAAAGSNIAGTWGMLSGVPIRDGGVYRVAAGGRSMYAAASNNANVELTLLRLGDQPTSRSGPGGTGVQATISTVFNTGFMVGDIRRCWLTETASGVISSTQELVTDGTFDNPATASSYLRQDANVLLPTVSGGVLSAATNASAGSDSIYYPITTQPGVVYTVTSKFTIGTNCTGGYLDARNGPNTAAPGLLNSALTTGNKNSTLSSLTPTITFIADSAATIIRLGLAKTQSAASGSWDNFSIKPVGIFDRSYKARTISLYGSLVKNAVGTDSQLVTYSGFSAANYLQEPYSADLDFGVGEWSVSAWVNIPAVLPADSFQVIGPEVLVNGDFSAGATGWTVSGTDATHIVTFSGGTMRYQSDTTTPVLALSQNVLSSGKIYEISGVVSAWTSGSIKSDSFGSPLVIAAGIGPFKVIGVASISSFQIVRNVANVDLTLESISIKEIGLSVIVERSAAYGLSNLLTESEFRNGLADAPTHNGLVTATTFIGLTEGTGLAFGRDGVTDSLAYRSNYSTVVGVTYTFTCFVRMDDSLPPTFGSGVARNVLNDFLLVTASGLQSPLTYIVVDMGGGLYRVSTQFTATVASTNTGVIKYKENSTRTFKVSGYQLVVGTVAGTYRPTRTIAFDGTEPLSSRRAVDGPYIVMGVDATGKLVATAFDGTTTRTVTSAVAYNSGVEIKAGVNYTTDGKLSLLINGSAVTRAVGVPLLTLSNMSAVTTLGNSYTLDAPFPGSIALTKLGITAPTAEQSVWMYEQEKQMFRDGAQVCLPDNAPISDMTYDETTDKWIVVTSANETSFPGLVRTRVTAATPATFTGVHARSGVKLIERATINPGVDISIPSYILREELLRRAETAAQQAKSVTVFEFDTSSFTANTNAGLAFAFSVTVINGVPYEGMPISGPGIAPGTTITVINGNLYSLSANATVSGTNVIVSAQTDFVLPIGFTALAVMLGGALKREGATKDYVRLFDGFKETIRFAVAPGGSAWVQIQAVRSPV